MLSLQASDTQTSERKIEEQEYIDKSFLNPFEDWFLYFVDLFLTRW
jgi:hypothetical protein